ncbi:MAG: hypothetical protein AAF985_20140, partial [Bacteroidota bacterium]
YYEQKNGRFSYSFLRLDHCNFFGSSDCLFHFFVYGYSFLYPHIPQIYHLHADEFLCFLLFFSTKTFDEESV